MRQFVLVCLISVEREDDNQKDDLFDGILSSHNFPDSENANRWSAIRDILCKDLYSLQYSVKLDQVLK